MKGFLKIKNSSLNISLLMFFVFIACSSEVLPQNFTMDQTLSEGAQRTTIAFDGLAFITGSLGADSFFPPGKVADFWGFQYLRDNDPSEMGHNTDFLTKAAYNMLSILDNTQFNKLKELAKFQIDDINDYGYNRFVLMKAFRRLLEGENPYGKCELNEDAIKNYSGQLYILDGQISYERAKVMGSIIASLTNSQKAYLDALKGKGMLEWPDINEPSGLKGLIRDEKIAVMTYGGDLLSWYLGDIDADVYFCPERQGTYFGSFYLKDAPAVGNPNYSIGTNITADYGNLFINTLTEAQAKKVLNLVEIQKPALLEIVDKRKEVSLLLREFISGIKPDSNSVISLMQRYGELDGEIIYNYVNCFVEIYKELNSNQITQLSNSRHELIGDLNPTGAYLYSTEISMPEIINTDFLFSVRILDADPDSLWNFGDVRLKEYVEKSLIIQNMGNTLITINDIKLSGVNSDQFSIMSSPSLPVSVLPEEPLYITIRFNPASSGVKSAFIDLYNNSDNLSPVKSVALTGNGLQIEPAISISITSLNDFGEVLTGLYSAVQSYSISAINLVSDITITAPDGFKISSDGITFSNSIMLTNSSDGTVNKSIYVVFHPESVGNQSGMISHSTTGIQTQNVFVGGTGIQQKNSLKGDIDENGIVMAYDASLLLKYIVGVVTFTLSQTDLADCDMNGLVQAYDAFYILKYVVDGKYPDVTVK